MLPKEEKESHQFPLGLWLMRTSWTYILTHIERVGLLIKLNIVEIEKIYKK